MKHSIIPLLLGCLSGFSVSGAQKPLSLFRFADDQYFETIHALNNPGVKTPHADTLVPQGMSFTHAYNSGPWGGSICLASRTFSCQGRQYRLTDVNGNIMRDILSKERVLSSRPSS